MNHFVKLALSITWMGLLDEALGPIYWGWALEVRNTDVFLCIVVVEMAVLVGVVACQPSGPRTRS